MSKDSRINPRTREGSSMESVRDLTGTSHELLAKIVTTSELSVDLAYSAIIFNSKDLAEDVKEMHSNVERMYLNFGKTVMELAREVERPENLFALLRCSRSFREISDAALSMAEVILKGLPSHELLAPIFEASDETFIKLTVEEKSRLAGKTFGEIRLQDETGMRVIVIKRGEGWIHAPSGNSRIEAGDIIFARGPVDGEESLRALASASQT